MTSPVVSIVIPCFRQGHFLAEAIDSALGQTHSRVEVVVVNDGSDDQTDEIARKYGDRIIYVSQENRGLSGARNAGIAVASGKYCLFLDSDDLLVQDAVRWLVSAADGREDVLCVVGYRFIDGVKHYPDRLPNERADATAALLRFNLGPPHTYLSSRSMVVSCGGFDAGLSSCEDWDLWVKMLFAGAELIPINRVGALYRQHSESMSRNGVRMSQTRIEVMSRIRSMVFNNPSVVRKLGNEPTQLNRDVRDLMIKEYLEIGYSFREDGFHIKSFHQYLLSVWWCKPNVKSFVHACKLLPHFCLRNIAHRK